MGYGMVWYGMVWNTDVSRGGYPSCEVCLQGGQGALGRDIKMNKNSTSEKKEKQGGSGHLVF